MNAPQPLHTLLQPAGQQSGRELPHESARLHVTGEAAFTDDLPEPRGTLYAALVTSPIALGLLVGPHNGLDKAALLAEHGVIAVFTAEDIPGENNCGPILTGDPFLADGTVQFLGQPVAVVVAREMLYAREAARRAQVKVFELPAVLTIEQALDRQSFVLPTKTLVRGDAAAAIAAAPHRLQGRVRCGQQEQFYLEGQITFAVPREDDQLTLYVSTQHPDGNQREAAAALELGTHDVDEFLWRTRRGFCEHFAGTPIISMEPGGKSAALVSAKDTSELDGPVGNAAGTLACNAGQSCGQRSRWYVRRDLYQLFLEKLAERARNLKPGIGSKQAVDLGPLVSKRHYEKVMSYIQTGVAEGARLIAGGGRPKDSGETGYFIAPTVFADCNNNMRIVSEEIFGPVISVIPVDSIDEAVALANDNVFGLSAEIWTNDLSTAHSLASKLVESFSLPTLMPKASMPASTRAKGSSISLYRAARPSLSSSS